MERYSDSITFFIHFRIAMWRLIYWRMATWCYYHKRGILYWQWFLTATIYPFVNVKLFPLGFRCLLLILSIASSATRVRDLHHCLNLCCVPVTVFYSINLFQRSLCWLLRLALFFSNLFVTSCFWACWLNELVWDAFALSTWWILGFLALWQLVFEWLKFYVMVESKGAGCWCFVVKLLVVVFAFKGLIFNIPFVYCEIRYCFKNYWFDQPLFWLWLKFSFFAFLLVLWRER